VCGKPPAEQTSLDADVAILTSAEIWAAIKAEPKDGGIEGVQPREKLQTWDTVEYGPISQKSIRSTLVSRFPGRIQIVDQEVLSSVDRK